MEGFESYGNKKKKLFVFYMNDKYHDNKIIVIKKWTVLNYDLLETKISIIIVKDNRLFYCAFR